MTILGKTTRIVTSCKIMTSVFDKRVLFTQCPFVILYSLLPPLSMLLRRILDLLMILTPSPSRRIVSPISLRLGILHTRPIIAFSSRVIQRRTSSRHCNPRCESGSDFGHGGIRPARRGGCE